MSTRGHKEMKVGGDLDDVRLRAIMERGFALRNMAVLGGDVFTYRASTDPAEPPPWSETHLANHLDGETPAIVYCEGDGETRYPSIELHVGCGDSCGVLAEIPYDHDSDGCDPFVAEAIVHAGRDLIDLVREVVRLRAALCRPSPPSSPTPPAPEAAPVPDLSSGATGSEGGQGGERYPVGQWIEVVSHIPSGPGRVRTCPDCTGRATHAGACLTCAGTGFVGVP